jgi:Na+-driven multidrug efflux pump
MRVFSADPEVVAAGRSYLWVAAFTLGAYVVLYQTVFMLQGLKRPLFGLWIGLYRQVAAPALLFPLLAFPTGADLGVSGIWLGIALVNGSAALVAWLYGRRLLRHVIDGHRP